MTPISLKNMATRKGLKGVKIGQLFGLWALVSILNPLMVALTTQKVDVLLNNFSKSHPNLTRIANKFSASRV
jgi:hypothetical protein